MLNLSPDKIIKIFTYGSSGLGLLLHCSTCSSEAVICSFFPSTAAILLKPFPVPLTEVVEVGLSAILRF
jgi:hypothetical protein